MSICPQNATADMHPPLLVDRASDDLVDQILEADAAKPSAFRTLTYVNRPFPSKSIRTVAFHYWRYGIGGAEKVTHALMGLFRSMGYEVTLYTDEPAQTGDYTLPEGVVRKTVPTTGKRERIVFWHNEVLQGRIDAMVYSSWLSPWAVADCLALQAAGSTVLYHTHGIATYFIGSDLGAGYLERTIKLAMVADTVIALSEADRLFWSAFSPAVSVVVNPVSLYLPDPPERTVPDDKTVLFCGRLDPLEKRPACALRIFGRAAQLVPDARMRFVGGGAPEETASLAQMCRELDIENHVEFLGFQDDPTPYLRSASVLIMTSPSEGFPLSLTEACCFGLPAVIFELPHLPIAAGNTGIVQVAQGDEDTAARALVRILANPDLQRDMGRATQEAYRRICCIDHAAAWRDVLRKAQEARDASHHTPAPDSSPQTAFVHLIVAGYTREIERVRGIQAHEQSLQQQVEETRRDLACITSSASFRIGRAITEIPRHIRDFLHRP